MLNIKIFADKYYPYSMVKIDNLNNYLPWMKNPLENQYMLSAKYNYSLDKLCTFIGNCNKGEDNLLLGIHDKNNDNYNRNVKYNDINKSANLGILIGKQKCKGVGVARQTIIISINWLNENLGIENIFLSVNNINTFALKLYQKLGLRPIANKGKNDLLMNLNINELKSNDS